MESLASSVSRLIQDQFRAVWIVLLLLTIWYAFRTWNSSSPGTATTTPTAARLSAADVAALACLAALFAWCAILIFYRAELADHDQSQLTALILRDRYFPPNVWPANGRFWPLGFQELNVLLMIGVSGKGFFVLPAIELAVLCGALLVLLRRFQLPARVLVIALILVTPSILLIYQGLIYPERPLILVLVLMVLGLQLGDGPHSRWMAVVTLGATHAALYLKEPVFVLVAGIAATRLIIEWSTQANRTRSALRRFLTAHPVELGMLALAAIFVGLYFAAMHPVQSMGYAERAYRGSPIETFAWYLRAHPILLVFLATVVVRATGIARRRVTPDKLWDPIAVGVLGYVAVYLKLGMVSTWYLAPVDVLGLLYVAEVARVAVDARKIRPLVPVAGACLLGLVLVLSSWYQVLRRKNIVYARAVLAEYVKRVADTSSVPVRVFLPGQTTFDTMEFGAFLQFKGVSVVADSVRHGPGKVVLMSPHPFPDGRCLPSRKIPCTSTASPPPGSLVLVMADDGPPEGSVMTLKPANPALAVRPFGVPAILPLLVAVQRVQKQDWSGGARSDFLWAYVEVAR